MKIGSRKLFTVLWATTLFVAPLLLQSVARATGYNIHAISDDQTNATIFAAQGDSLVYRDGIGLYYFNGTSSVLVQSISCGVTDAAFDNDYVAYIVNSCTAPGIVPYTVYVYNVSTQQRLQASNDSVQNKNFISISGDLVVWQQPNSTVDSSGLPQADIKLYNIPTGIETEISSTAIAGNQYLSPVVSAGSIYWINTRRDINVYDARLVNTSTLQTGPDMQDISSDGNSVVWDNDGQGNNINANIYLSDGNTTQIIDQNDYIEELKVKGKLVVWVSTKSAQRYYKIYNRDTGITQSIPTTGMDITTDGQKVIYVDESTGYDRPAVLDVSTGQTTYLDFLNGTISSSSGIGNLSVVTAPSYAAWIGYQATSAHVLRVFIAQPIADVIPPTVVGAPDRMANQNGWYNAPVTVAWNSTDPAPSSGAPTSPTPTVASLEGTHAYVSSQSCDPAGNCATGSLRLSIDSVHPSGAFGGSTVVVRLFGQKISGTAGDVTSGVTRVAILSSSGNKTFTSDNNGVIALNCNTARTSCMWVANPAILNLGRQTLSLTVTDAAGNVHTITKVYVII